ncbi:MAG: hypothetical protein HOQ00_09150 [Agromyces sp.]|nr:hypothetical protein [Agromyces sp.]
MRPADAAEPEVQEPPSSEHHEPEHHEPEHHEPEHHQQPGPVPEQGIPQQPAAPASASPRRTGLIVAGAVAGLIAVSLVGHQLVASAVHAWIWPAWAAADTRFDEASSAYEETFDRSDSAVQRAEFLLGMATGDLVRPEDRTALEESIAGAREVLEDRPAAPTGVVELGEPDSMAPAWERYGDLFELVDLVPSRNEAAVRFDDAAEQVAAGTKAIAEASETLLTGTEELARAALDASPSATYQYRFAVEDALAGLRHSPGVSSGDADRFTALSAAVAAVRASHATEEARRLEHPVRAEIEAFARSIASDVELEFAWAYTVAGRSSDAWYSGTAEFKPDGQGWGLISLTESIESEWANDVNAKAVVVHEVGHTQVLRQACYDIFAAAPFGGDHEVWATAWAIGMGYDLPGAGIEMYGRPSDAQIEASKACR